MGNACVSAWLGQRGVESWGATALFYSGGWRGVAAFSYVETKARGAVEAAEWLVEFSDSSDGDIP